MTINLNKKLVSEEELFKYIDHYDVYAKYIPDQEVAFGKNIYSPLRKREKNPSFGFFTGENGVMCFNDMTLKLMGNSVKFTMVMFNLNYFEALSKIATDFNMSDDFIVKKFNKQNYGETINNCKDQVMSKTFYKFKLGKKRRNWEKFDLEFWSQFGISFTTLKKYNVEPISHVFINDDIVNVEKHAYCFIEWKDGIETYKIYQPFSEKYKWLNSHDNSVWQGWSQLPLQGETLIITKSLKDVMAINEITGYDVVSLQSENVLPKANVLNDLKKRFENVILLYDNDYDKETNWGQEFSKKFSQEFLLFTACIDEKYKSKDFSDLVKNEGIYNARKILKDIILEIPF